MEDKVNSHRHAELDSASHHIYLKQFRMKTSYVYILTNKYRTTFYIGITSDLTKRISEHQQGQGSSFTEKYNLKFLIYYEEFLDIQQAIKREKQLKNWNKDWKIDLVKKKNPELKTIEFT